MCEYVIVLFILLCLFLPLQILLPRYWNNLRGCIRISLTVIYVFLIEKRKEARKTGWRKKHPKISSCHLADIVDFFYSFIFVNRSWYIKWKSTVTEEIWCSGRIKKQLIENVYDDIENNIMNNVYFKKRSSIATINVNVDEVNESINGKKERNLLMLLEERGHTIEI